MHAATPQAVPAAIAATPVAAPAQLPSRLRPAVRGGDAIVRAPSWHARLPLLEVDALWATAGRVVLVATRPGDGLPGAGGLLAAAAARGLPVWAWVLTDGDAGAAPAGVAPWRDRLDAALDALGVRSGGIERFRLPTGRLQAHRDMLEGCFRRLLQPGDVVLAPHAAAGCADDDVVAQAVAGAAGCTGCVHLGLPPLDAGAAHPMPAGAGWRRFEPGPELLARKRAALRAFGIAGGVIAAPAQAQPDIEILAPA